MKFKKNYHLARRYGLGKVEAMILNYPKQYSAPKYLEFIKTMIGLGWEVKVYVARVSKYIFITKGDNIFKIRFSNHKPLYEKEIENDCDFYVGISHKQVATTDEIIGKLKNI